MFSLKSVTENLKLFHVIQEIKKQTASFLKLRSEWLEHPTGVQKIMGSTWTQKAVSLACVTI